MTALAWAIVVANTAAKNLYIHLNLKELPGLTALSLEWGSYLWIGILPSMIIGILGIRKHGGEWSLVWSLVSTLVFLGLSTILMSALLLPFATFTVALSR